ncbi:MAG: hypothetical protein V4584_04025 [Verrucomicrobiota bacterium]
MTGSGSTGTAMFHLLRMGFRLLIFLLIVAAGGWIYVVKMTQSEKFQDGLKGRLKSGLAASEMELKKFSRSQGELSIGRLASQGGKETFFTSLEASGIRCKMGFLDGVYGTWDAGTVSIAKLDMELRAGADDADSAKMLSKSLFSKSADVVVDVLEVADASLRWGYSDRTKGGIENSMLKVQRLENGLKLSFRGGTFSQNWLRKLEIVELVINCDPDGMTFEKAQLRSGPGTVDFSGLKVVGGERPSVSGVAKIRKLGVENMVPAALKGFIDGSLSGDFRVSGSTNSAEGIGFEGRVDLDGQDTLTLGQRIHLLQSLSMVDYVRNYHRVDFREGSFNVKTSGGGMKLTDVNLKADDLFTLQGDMTVRLPTPEESRASMEADAMVGSRSRSHNGDDVTPADAAGKAKDTDFTLRNAGRETKRSKEGIVLGGSDSLFDRLGSELESRQLQVEASERASRTLRYEGLFRITIPADAFEAAPKMAKVFPVDERTGRIPMMVPIEGSIYEITFSQAKEMSELKSR